MPWTSGSAHMCAPFRAERREKPSKPGRIFLSASFPFRSLPESGEGEPKGGVSRPWLLGYLVTRLLATGYGAGFLVSY